MPTLLRPSLTDQGRFEESAGWRMLAGSLWTAILVLSLLGLRWPLTFSPVLLLQLIYKSLWLAMYGWPLWRAGHVERIPPGMAWSFLGIVLLWPWLIPWRHLFSR